MTNNEIAFTLQQIDAAYINSLVDLVNACRELNIKIDKVAHYQHGWDVTFKGFKGDAICHSGSCGSPCHGGLYNPDVERKDWGDSGHWETYGFPWDNGDVSVHSARALVYMLKALRDGFNWEPYENCDD